MADRLAHRLTWHAWLAHLDALARACAGATRADAPEMVRELNTLIHRAPSQACHEGLAALDPLRLEALLDIGMADGALLAMLTADCGFIASRGRGDAYFVTVVLPDGGHEEAAFGESVALAGVRAAIAALAAPAARMGTPRLVALAVPAAVH